MRYAIMSDIHGNLPALEAAIADAKKRGAERFVFLGDYYITLPWANEVAEVLRGLDSAMVIRGNNEDYLINVKKQRQVDWRRKQFGPLYWNYRTLTPENFDYLTTRPATAVVAEGGSRIHLAHAMDLFFRTPKVSPFHSEAFRELMEKKPFTHEEYLLLARDALISRPDALEEMRALPEGVYLFGHNHLQFHMEYEGKLFVNPGSCGVSCDGDPTAAYTLLTRAGKGWSVEERRAAYDIDATAAGLRRSSFSAEAPIWSGIIERQMRTGKDHVGPFVSHIAKTGRDMGETSMPVSNDVWDAAVKTWNEMGLSR